MAELEFCLESRTEVPVGKVAELKNYPPAELKRIATNIHQVRKRLAEVVTRSIQEPGTVSELLQELEIKLFSNDHEWRDIIEALNRQPATFDEYKRIALMKYMEYLSSRLNILKRSYMDKTRHGHPQALRNGKKQPADRESVDPNRH